MIKKGTNPLSLGNPSMKKAMSPFDTTPFNQYKRDFSRCRKHSARDSLASISTAEFTLFDSVRSSGSTEAEALFSEARESCPTEQVASVRSSLVRRSVTLKEIPAIL